MDQSPVSVVITDPGGCIEYVNPKFTRVTGYELNEVLGKTPRILKSGRQSKEFYEELWDTILSGKNYVCEMYNKKKDGTYYWEKAFISPLLNQAGDITHFVAIKEDITEKKINEESLNLFRMLVNHTNDTIEIVDPESGRFILCNDKSYQSLGYTQEEFLSKKVWDIDPNVTEKVFVELVGSIRESEGLLIESIHRRKDGSRFEVELNIKLVNLERDYLIVVGRNITKRKAEEKELINAKESAERSNKLKDAFIANISHEIRTPLNGILGLTGILRENYGDIINVEDYELFQGIDSSGKRIIRTIDMILNYSRLQVGEYSVEKKNVNVASICRTLLNEYRSSAEFKSLELTFENKCRNCIIESDEYSLTQAISNLIDNSIKYTKDGFVKLNLYRNENGELVLDISDSGIGMSKDFQELVFEPYMQEQMGYGRAYEGVGLGLSLVKKFIETINGKLNIESKKGNGTTVSINFGKVIKKDSRETEPIKIKVPPGKLLPVKKDKLVLLVEDDVMNQATIKRIIKNRYELLIADSSDSAMEILRENSVDLILMDISIVGSKNGLELTSELKDDDRYSGIPIIAVTAHAFEVDRLNALEAGCDDYLAKPFSLEELLERIRAFI